MNTISVLPNAVINWNKNTENFAKLQNSYKTITENDKVSNNYFWKSNQYVGEDCFGRTLDLTSIIDKPDGYLQGKLSDTEDVDYYKFNISEYRALSVATDKYNLDITITLDNIPEGCDYDLVLYDEAGNQVGIGIDNGNGGKSITVPNWNMENRGYTVKVQAKDGSPVKAEEYYHLSFQTKQADKDNMLSQEIKEMQEYGYALRQKLHEGQDAAEEKQALQEIREKYAAYYAEQLNKLHMEQAKKYLQDGKAPDNSDIGNLLMKMAEGETLTEQEKGLVNIFATAQEIDSAKANAELNTTLKEEIFSQMEKEKIDLSQYSFDVQIGAGGQVTVEGINEEAVKTKINNIFSQYADRLMDIYFSTDTNIQNLSEREKTYLKLAVDVEKFLNKATNGSVSLDDLTVENGKIKGLPANLDKLINYPGENKTYAGYQEDILAIKNFEKAENKKILESVNVKYVVSAGNISIN